MRTLITGAAGQIGLALRATAPPGVEVVAVGREELDVTSAESVTRMVRDIRPALVLNAAGYTAVDKAESEPAVAAAVNGDGPRHLASALDEYGGRLIHLSTDYVFDGAASRPYLPNDSPDPINVYGVTKLAGERAVLDILDDRAIVVRTSWVYAPWGHNFLRTMVRLLNDRGQVTVVSDQTGAPTSATSVARAAWAIAGRPRLAGVTHWTDGGSTTWFEFALAIQQEAVGLDLVSGSCRILPVTTDQYGASARRPRYSVLDCSAAQAALGVARTHWRTELREALVELARG